MLQMKMEPFIAVRSEHADHTGTFPRCSVGGLQSAIWFQDETERS